MAELRAYAGRGDKHELTCSGYNLRGQCTCALRPRGYLIEALDALEAQPDGRIGGLEEALAIMTQRSDGDLDYAVFLLQKRIEEAAI